MPLYAIEGKQPVLGADAWVAPSADVIGDAHLGDEASVWFGAVIRGGQHADHRRRAQQYPGGRDAAFRSRRAADDRRRLHDRPPRDAPWLHDRRQCA